jgi:hypothetical protein
MSIAHKQRPHEARTPVATHIAMLDEVVVCLRACGLACVLACVRVCRACCRGRARLRKSMRWADWVKLRIPPRGIRVSLL